MTQNLRIVNRTLTSSDSDVSSNFVLPANNSSWGNRNYTIGVYVSPAIFGGHYTYAAATAGEGTEEFTKIGGDAQHSLCPKKWRLPNRDEYQVLYDNYNGKKFFEIPVNLSKSGHSGSLNQSENVYWSSTADGNINYVGSYRLDVNDSGFGGVSSCYHSYGFALRCITR